MRCVSFLLLIFLVSFLVGAQEPTQEEPKTEEKFKDPFAIESQPLPTAEPKPTESAPTEPPPNPPQENSEEPPFEEKKEPEEKPEETVSFPEPGEDKNPVTQEVFRAIQTEEGTLLGTWNLEALGGYGGNIHRRPEQVQTEIGVGYRFWRKGEIGLRVFSRFIEDQLLGILIHYEGFYRLTRPPKMRIEWLYGGGVGWTLRANRVGSNFSEGRLTGRLETGFIFYAFPYLALLTKVGGEAFFLNVTNDGNATNLFKGEVLPAEWFALGGIRVEF